MPLLVYAEYMPSVIAEELVMDNEKSETTIEIHGGLSCAYIRTKLRQSKSPRSNALTSNSAVATLVASGML